MKTVIPNFPGYYESSLSAAIDDATRNCNIEKFDNRRAFLALSQAWLDCWNEETGLNAKFIKVESPREYNFETDKLFADIDPEVLYRIKKKCFGEWSDEFKAILDEYLTPRSGFMPFYSNDPEEWRKPLREYSPAECQMLVATMIMAEGIEIEDSPDRPCFYEAAQAGWMP